MFSLWGWNAETIKLGYVPELDRIKPLEKTIDVLLYGLAVPRRIEVISKLEKDGVNVRIEDNLWGRVLDHHIARSKVVLQVNSDERSNVLASQFRLFYLFNNRACVVCEDGDEKVYNNLLAVPFSQIAEASKKVLNIDGWKGIGDAMYYEFKEMPFEKELRRLL